jgi:hypothetical protein
MVAPKAALGRDPGRFVGSVAAVRVLSPVSAADQIPDSLIGMNAAGFARHSALMTKFVN